MPAGGLARRPARRRSASAGAAARAWTLDGQARPAGPVRQERRRLAGRLVRERRRSRPRSASTRIVGNYASPYTPGSAYVLLHHVFGEVNGKKGAWGHAIGGMGAITQAMAAACARGRRRDRHRRAGARGR